MGSSRKRNAGITMTGRKSLTVNPMSNLSWCTYFQEQVQYKILIHNSQGPSAQLTNTACNRKLKHYHQYQQHGNQFTCNTCLMYHIFMRNMLRDREADLN